MLFIGMTGHFLLLSLARERKGPENLEACFEKGKRHGPYTSWRSNGNKKEEGAYENSERVYILCCFWNACFIDLDEAG